MKKLTLFIRQQPLSQKIALSREHPRPTAAVYWFEIIQSDKKYISYVFRIGKREEE